jgi:hypothetical protein
MDSDVRTRTRLAEHWHASERGDIEAEHAIYAADAVLDYPQSGERFRGRGNIQAQRGGHAAKRHFTIRRISGIGDLWVSEFIITYDGVPTFTVSIMEFTEGYVTHETQYFGDKFEAASRRRTRPAGPWVARLSDPPPRPWQLASLRTARARDRCGHGSRDTESAGRVWVVLPALLPWL